MDTTDTIRRSVSAAIALALFGFCTAANAQSGDDDTWARSHYAGKTVTIHAGFGPGGTGSNESALLARYIGKQIPGNPTVIVSHMPGAGSLTLTNYMYNVASGEGYDIGRITNTLALGNLLGMPNVNYQADKFPWLGSYVLDTWLLVMSSKSGLDTLDKLKAATKKPHIGARSVSDIGYKNTRVVEEATGLKFEIVTGYNSGDEIGLAIARGEVDGQVIAYNSFVSRNLQQYRNKEIVVPLQSGRGANHDPLPFLETTPVVWKIAPPEAQPFLQAASLPWNAPFLLSPKTSPQAVRVLRAAFSNLAKDSEFAAAYEKTFGLPIDLTTGEQMQKDVAAFSSVPPKVVETLKTIFEAN